MTDELAIVVCTYNRCATLAACLDGIARCTRTPHQLLVVDDGSTDETTAMLKQRGTPVLSGPNRGIAWNKNRGLFYFSRLEPCRAIILIEDDCCPEKEGWEHDWVEGARKWGHVNHAGRTVTEHIIDGAGSVDDPFRSPQVSGQCASFSNRALSFVGFMDTRFGRYGHEHVEHTLRFLRAGYGGRLGVTETDPPLFYLVNGDISTSFTESYRTEESVQRNGQIFAAIRDEPIYRSAWRTDEELNLFRAEMQSVAA